MTSPEVQNLRNDLNKLAERVAKLEEKLGIKAEADTSPRPDPSQGWIESFKKIHTSK